MCFTLTTTVVSAATTTLSSEKRHTTPNRIEAAVAYFNSSITCHDDGVRRSVGVGLQIVVIDFVRKPITRETRETVWPTVMGVTGAEDVTGDALGVLGSQSGYAGLISCGSFFHAKHLLKRAARISATVPQRGHHVGATVRCTVKPSTTPRAARIELRANKEHIPIARGMGRKPESISVWRD